MNKHSAALIGLGYVGLPLAILLKRKKLKFLVLTLIIKLSK